MFAAEKQQYIREIDALRSKASRVEGLEEENRKLLAELESTKQQIHRRLIVGASQVSKGEGASNVRPENESEAKTVDVEEYNRVKDLLAKSDGDYGKVLHARQKLESKLRHYKDMIKQWREYTDRLVWKNPEKGLKSLELEASKASPVATISDLRYSSAPAPRSILDGMTPSVSDISRDTSPWTDLERAQNRQGTSPPLTLKPLPDRTLSTQRALDAGHRASSGDLTEASDESGRPPSLSSKARSHSSTNVNGRNAEEQAEDDGSSPIIVSERSLKRKRPIKVHEDDFRTKPPPVKDEQRCSSPLVAPTALRFGGLHDSLDLDDVGGHIDTPRKRRKSKEMRLRSSLISPNAVRDETRMLDDPISQDPEDGILTEDEVNKQTVSDVRPIPPKPVAKKRDQDDDEQQRKSRKVLSKAQQQAHNKRVSERLEAVEPPTVCDARSSKSTCTRPLDQRVFGNSQSPAPRDYPTPATEDQVQPHTPQGRREMEQRRAALASPIILQPTDPNAHILPRTNEKFANQQPPCPPSRRDRSAAHVPVLAEDGEEFSSVSSKPKVKKTDSRMSPDKAFRSPDLRHRLGTLLSEPPPTKFLLESTRTRLSPPKSASSETPIVQSDCYAASRAPDTPLIMPAQRTLPRTSSGNRTGLKQYRGVEGETRNRAESARATDKNQATKYASRRLPLIDQSVDARPEHEPLRARPVHRLRIEDFKLNAAHSDYAYHESVRKHDEKKALSGCTDRNCPRCKDIRKFVENSGYARVPGQDQEETDRRLLAAFLGNDKDRLKKLSAEEMKELLLQAKSQQFATEFGKHRTPFQRAQSPVDYWNVGFPSTQEHKQNLEAVRTREREQVKEMYWEAIRERGRYSFADE